MKHEAVRTDTVFPWFPDYEYPDVTFHIEFQRRSLFYVLNIIVPSGIIAVLTIVTFILPQESGEKIPWFPDSRFKQILDS